MIEGWVDIDHDYILKNKDVIQIHIDPPPIEGVDPIALLAIINFSGLIALLSILYFWKRKQRKYN